MASPAHLRRFSRAGALAALAIAALATPSCGARTPGPIEEGEGGGTTTETPEAVALFVASDQGCGEEADLDDAVASFNAASSGDFVWVVDLAFVDECTGAGGQHILARTRDGQREFWLGAHACRFFDDARMDGALHPGVVLASSTAALFHTPEGACVSFPGETEGLTSDSHVVAVALFASNAEAQAFADAVD